MPAIMIWPSIWKNRLKTLPYPLAIASEHALLHNSRQDVKRLLDVSHRKNSALVKSIAIFNADHELFVTTNYHKDFAMLKYAPDSAIPQQSTITDLGQLVGDPHPYFAGTG